MSALLARLVASRLFWPIVMLLVLLHDQPDRVPRLLRGDACATATSSAA